MGPVVTASNGRRFAGTADDGHRGGEQPGGQISASQLKTMTAEQIVAARKAGRLANLLKG
jgi:hypothetical protein